jgi:hypothetical protein
MLSLQLADFGADVIKVEPPAGDPLRDWREGGQELHWKTYARNKRSIVLNLRHAGATGALLRLVENADVFIENFRPGTLEEMDLGPEILFKANPDLILMRVASARPAMRRSGLRNAVKPWQICRAQGLPPRTRPAAIGAGEYDRGPIRGVCDYDGAACATRARCAAKSSTSRSQIDFP